MQVHVVLALTAGLLVGAGRGKDEEPELPKGPPPIQTVARMDRSGNLVIRTVVPVTAYRQVQRTRLVNQGGKQVPVTETVTVAVVTQLVRQLKSPKFQVFEAGGKKGDPKDLARRLKKWTPVLLSADGKKVDPFYLQVIKDETLVVLLPAGLQGGPERMPDPRPKDE
jgi:hypothetical protein